MKGRERTVTYSDAVNSDLFPTSHCQSERPCLLSVSNLDQNFMLGIYYSEMRRFRQQRIGLWPDPIPRPLYRPSSLLSNLEPFNFIKSI